MQVEKKPPAPALWSPQPLRETGIPQLLGALFADFIVVHTGGEFDRDHPIPVALVAHTWVGQASGTENTAKASRGARFPGLVAAGSAG